MAEDPFQDLLGLEDEFYKEGYEAGVADGEYAGMIEGKVFGIEKGYEKALDLAKMHGRAMVWNIRLAQTQQPVDVEAKNIDQGDAGGKTFDLQPLEHMQSQLNELSTNIRLQKHIETLLMLTDGTDMRPDNDDEAVTEFDDRLGKARAKAKVIANIAGESLNPVTTTNSGIEDATGLNARH